MNFYTLTYDANLPTKQQINVPTNTDYKLGIKVRRNGEIQNLSPESVTLGGLSADPVKTNGYVTFTLSAGDNASYTSEKLDIEKGYDAEFYDHNETVNTSGATATYLGLSADMSEYAGVTIKPDDVLLYAKQAPGTTPPTEEEMLSGATTYWDLPTNFAPVELKPFIVDASGTPKVYTYTNDVTKTEVLNALGWPADKPAFFCVNAAGTNIELHETYTFADGDKLTVAPNVKLRNNRNLAVLCKFVAGTPFSAKFDLNTNIFKSQQGDICEIGKRANTVSIAGTLPDNTPFDYNVVIK